MSRWIGDPRRFTLGKSGDQIDASLRRLVRYAYAHVSVFRDRIDAADLRASDVRSVSDLVRIPPSDRRAFLGVDRADYLRAGVDSAACRRTQTSGTTGTPLDIYMSSSEALYRRVLLFAAIRRNARLPIPFTIAEVGTGLVGYSRRGPSQTFGWAHVVRIPRLLSPQEQAEQVEAARPDVITGPPSCLELLADELVERRRAVRPRLVVTRGEMLRTAVREGLQQVFATRVVDYYNCDEVGNIAWECPQNPGVMHVNTDACIVETVGDDGHRSPDGVSGRVVLTNLYNWTMPFVRYELGDRAALMPASEEPCRCGQRGPSLSRLEGRDGDHLWLPDGRRVSPRTIDSLIACAVKSEEDPQGYAARRYQVIQESHGGFRVRVIPTATAPDDLSERIAASLRRLGPQIEVLVEIAEDLPAEPSGKFRAVYSKRGSPDTARDA